MTIGPVRHNQETCREEAPS